MWRRCRAVFVATMLSMVIAGCPFAMKPAGPARESRPVDKLSFDMPSEGWVLVGESGSVASPRVTALPKSQKDQNEWTMAVKTGKDKRTPVDPTLRQLYDKFRNRKEEACPGQSQWEVLEDGPRSLLFERRTAECGTHRPEHELALLVDGSVTRFRVSVTAKAEEMDEDTRQAWLMRLKRATITTHGPPGTSVADATLQRDTIRLISLYEMSAEGTCDQWRVVTVEVVGQPRKPGEDPWTEKWTVDRCGSLINYSVKFTPTPRIGGTDIAVSPEK